MKKKMAFTIIEVLLVIIIIGLSLTAIIISLNNGLTFIQKMREKTIAINLAREGMEAVYQIRDSNRLRWAGRKENCRLKKEPLKDETSNTDCSDDPRLSTGYYILLTMYTGNQKYFYLSGAYPSGVNLSNGSDTRNRQFSLCKTGNNTRSACIGSNGLNNEGEYFREIRGIGLFDKAPSLPTTGGIQIYCSSGVSSLCGGAGAKEYRFCSKVSYRGKSTGEVEFCGILTNFQKK